MIRAHVDTRGADAKLARLAKRAKDLRPVWTALKPEVLQDIKEHAIARTGPDGPWQAYAPSTLKKLRGRRGMVFRRGKRRGQYTQRGTKRMANMLGKLRTAIKVRATAHRLEAWSRAPWAGVHQLGGTGGRGARIPRREFVFASQALVRSFRKKLLAHIEAGR